jgi:calreticulin
MLSNFIVALAVVCALFAQSHAKTYFKEDFNDKGWSDRWTVPSKWKSAGEMGEWKHTTGEFFASASDKGVQTSEDARFYGMTAKMDESFTSEGKQLVLQFSVKHEQDLDCGGAYIKLLPGDVDRDSFGGDTEYAIMFGPDVCGSSNRKTHVIFNYPPKNDNLLIKKEVRVETDKLTHLYTLVVEPDNTFKVMIDQEVVREGKLEDEFDFLLPKEIKDPEVSKPKDWVDAKKIPDPEDEKPEGYDDIPESIPDPEASKPDDWDDDEDGEWEAPMVDNPDFKGPWKPKMIDNPDYKGPWEHPMIPNPDYVYDEKLHARCTDCTHVGFELWQVKSGTIFDDIIVTDSLEEAEAYAKETTMKKKGPEKEKFEEAEKERLEAEAAARAEAEEAMGEAGDEDEEEEEDEDNDEL